MAGKEETLPEKDKEITHMTEEKHEKNATQIAVRAEELYGEIYVKRLQAKRLSVVSFKNTAESISSLDDFTLKIFMKNDITSESLKVNGNCETGECNGENDYSKDVILNGPSCENMLPEKKVSDVSPMNSFSLTLKAPPEFEDISVSAKKNDRKLSFRLDDDNNEEQSVYSGSNSSSSSNRKSHMFSGYHYNESHDKNCNEKRLLTGSRYSGVWLSALQCMDGYGTYIYPDGSEYRGYFQRGYFNGYGRLHLASPYNFTFKGTFIDGVLHDIEDMWFDDGLHVMASFRGQTGDFSQWRYCCPKDRRYVSEHIQGIPPVGPLSFLTARKPPRNLQKNQFDVEEGIYNADRELIQHRPLPFNKVKVVACDAEIQWIKDNCRQSSSARFRNLDSSVCQRIIENNLRSERDLREHDLSCNYDQIKQHKRYFAKLYREEGGIKEIQSEDSLGHCFPDTSSHSKSSFSDQSISIDLKDTMNVSDGLNLGRNLERDIGTSDEILYP
ncbi:uncharacterized protein LOC142237266 [Haematobia irritans]|uniref:uncharacterized protein LOC142237266 n=1 Tax=Haematobia irritans TaxID=7368 RepID=UPI003F4FA6B3